ncbi:MAG: hypothetical protein D3910_11520 [Candidatus Electrothrix sp. ATG2]|nr:hypothetical protein [Candidatus Electrothrix sp. ATG2]
MLILVIGINSAFKNKVTDRLSVVGDGSKSSGYGDANGEAPRVMCYLSKLEVSTSSGLTAHGIELELVCAHANRHEKGDGFIFSTGYFSLSSIHLTSSSRAMNPKIDKSEMLPTKQS